MRRLALLLDTILNTTMDLLLAPLRWLFRPDPETDPSRAAAAGIADAAASKHGTTEEDQVTSAAKATRALARILASGAVPTAEELAPVPKMAQTWLQGLTRDQQQLVAATTTTKLCHVLGGQPLRGVPSILATLAKTGQAPEPAGLASRLETLRARRVAERDTAPLVPAMA